MAGPGLCKSVGVLLGVAGSALVLCGCAGYHLGPTTGAVAGAQSIQVNRFQNQTFEPRLVEAVVSALRKNLQQDGTYQLETHNEADVVVNGVIVKYSRHGLSFQPDDVITVRDFQAVLVAKITAVDRRTGRVILDREVAGRTSIRIGPDLASAERQALPLLAEDLAKHTTALLVDGEW